jgi:broad specificity phosphatase PhoE
MQKKMFESVLVRLLRFAACTEQHTLTHIQHTLTHIQHTHTQVRLLRFAAWCFDAPLTKGGEVTVIVSGHSLFFRTLFQAFLPHAAEHLAKTHKIANAGAVAITLERGSVDGVMLYRIPTASIQTIYGGWSK